MTVMTDIEALDRKENDPNFYVFLPMLETIQADIHNTVEQMYHMDGAVHVRMSRVGEDHKLAGEEYAIGVWIEGWKTIPNPEPEFNPPLTLRREVGGTDG